MLPRKLLLLLSLFWLFNASPVMAAQPFPAHFGSFLVQSDDNYSEQDDFNPLLGMFALAAVGAMLVGIGAGAVLAVVGVLLIASLLAAGLLSTSVLVGLQQKSLTKGLKAFVIASASLGGTMAGSLLFWVANRVLHWLTPASSGALGAACGLLAGLISAYVALRLFRTMLSYFKAFFNSLKATS